MFTIYVYVLDALADWELGYVISEVNSGRFFKKDAQRVSLKTVSYSGKPIKTMGGAVIKKAEELLSSGALVCAICGATAALAGAGLLDNRPHTSNGPGFLEMFSPGYKGQDFYIDKPSVADNNLITAGSAGALLWAKQIIGHLNVFQPDTLESWYAYFTTGKPEHFFALMQTLPSGKES